jgi:competence protein ComFC
MKLNKILEIIFDKECIFCGSKNLSESITMICNDCLKAFKIKKIKSCGICGHPFDDFNQCPSCRKLGRIYFDSYFFIQYYTEFIKKIIYMLKKDEIFIINKLFFELIIQKNIIKKDGIITVVPDNPYKKFKKGRSSLSYLLKLFAKKGYIIDDKIYHKRFKFYKSQKLTTGKNRINNVRESFYLQKENINKYKGKAYLIDDVYTTGATLNHGAELLKKAGFKEVVAISFVRALINEY